MSGVTNKAYRHMVKSFGCDIVFPEFVSTYALHYNSEKTLKMLEFDASERPIIAQVFGAVPEHFFEAAEKIVSLGFDGIDINFGCPAPKVAKNGGGCALLGDLELSREVIQATLDGAAGRVPVSVKTRMSYRTTHVRDFCATIADMPLAALCVHGRPFEKPYLGPAQLDPIREVKTLVPFPVMASGHAHTPEAAKETLDYTGADGVALARGTFGKPWLAKQIKEYLATGSYWQPSLRDVLDAMCLHARLAAEMNTERPFVEIRKVLGWYIHGIPGAASFRARLVRVNTLEEIETIAHEIAETAVVTTG